jgi:hypothetical protein
LCFASTGLVITPANPLGLRPILKKLAAAAVAVRLLVAVAEAREEGLAAWHGVGSALDVYAVEAAKNEEPEPSYFPV